MKCFHFSKMFAKRVCSIFLLLMTTMVTCAKSDQVGCSKNRTFGQSCQNECMDGYYLDCDGDCSSIAGIRYSKTWLCNDKCQAISKPCNGECLQDYALNCQNDCQPNRDFGVTFLEYNCHGRCQSWLTPCDGICLKNSIL